MCATDRSGAVTTAFTYGPFGEIIEQVGATDTHLRRFNGKEADQLSRLNYYGYRYYDPLSLTWTQADPLFRLVPDLAYDQPRLMSLYAFSLNNPVRYMDPDGRVPFAVPAVAACARTPACAAAAGAVAVAAYSKAQDIIEHGGSVVEGAVDAVKWVGGAFAGVGSDITGVFTSTDHSGSWAEAQSPFTMLASMSSGPSADDSNNNATADDAAGSTRTVNPSRAKSKVWGNLDNAGRGRRSSGKGKKKKYHE